MSPADSIPSAMRAYEFPIMPVPTFTPIKTVFRHTVRMPMPIVLFASTIVKSLPPLRSGPSLGKLLISSTTL
jgi:hypothetical protein